MGCVPTACCWESFCSGAEPAPPGSGCTGKVVSCQGTGGAWGRHPAKAQSLLQSGLWADPAVFQA